MTPRRDPNAWLLRPARAFSRKGSNGNARARRPSHGRVIVVALVAMFATLSPAQDQPVPTTSSPATSNFDVHFQSVDVTLDPKGQPLAAYQIEFVADAARVKLVGVEGGDHAAFREPPYYDPAALSQHRVILAAFSTSADLPRSATRVARLHVQISGDGQPEWSAKLIVASSDKSGSIPGEVSLSDSEGVKR